MTRDPRARHFFMLLFYGAGDMQWKNAQRKAPHSNLDKGEGKIHVTLP